MIFSAANDSSGMEFPETVIHILPFLNAYLILGNAQVITKICQPQ